MSPADLHLAILKSASLLVREHQRAEWLAEWRSELWHTGREPHGLNVTVCCLGAFRDAFWLRRNGPLPRSYGMLHLDLPACPAVSQIIPDHGTPFLNSPARCLSFLALLAAISISFSFLLPAARSVTLPSAYPDARTLVMLASADQGDAARANGLFDAYPSVSAAQFRSLKSHGDSRFADLAFYVPQYLQVGQKKLRIARTSADLFRMLNIPVPLRHNRTASLVLARAAWRRFFNGDSRIVGREVRIAEQPAIVAGVLSPAQWTLPGNVDGWLIEDESALAGLPAYAEGYTLARLRAGAPTGHASPDTFDYISLPERNRQILIPLLLEFFVGCLLALFGTSLSLGDYPQNVKPGRWLFLIARIVLILPVVFFGGLDLASIGSSISPMVMAWVGLGALFATRWTLADQRRRCPVCLRLLANPVRIGQSSRMLLEWHGTELMCLRGHGLLHVPERPAIWFTSQRWMDLDSSWSGLFPDPGGRVVYFDWR